MLGIVEERALGKNVLHILISFPFLVSQGLLHFRIPLFDFLVRPLSNHKTRTLATARKMARVTLNYPEGEFGRRAPITHPETPRHKRHCPALQAFLPVVQLPPSDVLQAFVFSPCPKRPPESLFYHINKSGLLNEAGHCLFDEHCFAEQFSTFGGERAALDPHAIRRERISGRATFGVNLGLFNPSSRSEVSILR